MASPATKVPTTQQLRALGQSVWLDNIRRSMLTSGSLAQMIQDGWITGMTSNPSIFEKAFASTHDYDEDFRRLASGPPLSAYDAFVAIAIEDIRGVADALRQVYDRSEKQDGFVSLELPPGLERDTEKCVAEAKRLFRLVDRPNVMIKVPGTPEGLEAVDDMIFEGINTNITLLFAISAYEGAAEGYLRGMERRLEAGKSLRDVASVASFFVSRMDTLVEGMLPSDSPLRGKAGVANARRAYRRFTEIFAGERWERLARAGAQVQKPLWASTSTKNPEYSDVLYVRELIAPNTVNTMPEATLDAVLDHLEVSATIEPNLEDADRVARGLAAAGIDMEEVTAKLLVDGLAGFQKDFDALLAGVAKSVAAARVGRWDDRASLDDLQTSVARRLDQLDKDGVVGRVWRRDHTVWKPDPTEITNRLDWLSLPETMKEHAAELSQFARDVWAEGYTTAVLLGMGGSSLAPEVLQTTPDRSEKGGLDLKVLDTTDPEQIAGVEAELDLERTLFIVASKSGTTIETTSQFAYFWEKIPDGRHFIAITDPGTPLEKLAGERGFRKCFANPPDIGGRYSALSYFGLVPAALIGIDVAELLERAHEMMAACGGAGSADDNPGAWLGTILGEAALAGRNKLTLVMPVELGALGYWIEQLVAESTGKEGKGILPVEGEALGPPEVYGRDRLFVAIGDNPRLQALEQAGHPVVRLAYRGPEQLAAEFYRWEFAVAVAGHILQINPFDQPNVQEAKDATNRILGGESVDEHSDSADAVLAQVREGDYIALTAYVPHNAEWKGRLQRARMALRDRYHVATTVGFGPRFLHSTGQIHKGGPNQGVFLQIVSEDEKDLAIPGKGYSFGQLKRAQAAGDLASLRAHGRRVARVAPGELAEIAR